MTDDAWEKMQASLPWEVLDAPAPAPASRPAMVRPHAPRWAVVLAFGILLGIAVLVAFNAWRMYAPPAPGVTLYKDILAATPDTRIHHGYSLMCKGEVREYAGLDALGAAVPVVLADLGKRSGKVYSEADCACIQPYYEGDGLRTCSLRTN